MNLDRATRLLGPLRLDVGVVGRFCGGEGTKVMVDTININPSNPLAFSGRCSHEPMTAIGVGGALVVLVDALRHVTQVADGVVGAAAVSVVNLTGRPLAMDVEPRKSLGSVVAAVDADLQVSLIVQASSNGADRSLASPDKPSERAGFAAVVQEFAQTLRGKIMSSHFGLRNRSGGQMPGRIGSARWASSFYSAAGHIEND